jgi:hypothetical protein
MVWPASAHAACSGWDIAGVRQLTHENGQNVTVTLQQSGNELSGIGAYGASNDGIARGTIEGDQVRMTIVWASDGSAGQYQGVIDADGRISGVAFNDITPAVRSSWHADRAAGCNG